MLTTVVARDRRGVIYEQLFLKRSISKVICGISSDVCETVSDSPKIVRRSFHLMISSLNDKMSGGPPNKRLRQMVMSSFTKSGTSKSTCLATPTSGTVSAI